MKHFTLFFFITIVFGISQCVYSQKIDVDSLLTKALEDTRNSKFQKALEETNLGIKLAPEYLDYYLLKGRIFQKTQQSDSAQYYYNYVLDKNTQYQDALFYLIEVDFDNKNYENALLLAERGIVLYPKQETFYLKKRVALEFLREEKKEYEFIKLITPQFPNNEDLKIRLLDLETKMNSDRLGVNYSYTTFNRDQYGPWHLANIQYIRERVWGSLIGRVSYANRFINGESIAEGLQYEAESYFFTGKKSYSYVGAAYSDATVFPEWRLGYSFFYNFNKGWEGDLGIRYTKFGDQQFNAAVLGFGKYIDSFWFNLRSYILFDSKNTYPAFTLTSRYYFDTRFDYATLIMGYGTSPDERTTLGQFDTRIALNSYRIGAGYYRYISKQFITGLQTTYNKQEYAPNKTQSEIEISISLQYKL